MSADLPEDHNKDQTKDRKPDQDADDATHDASPNPALEAGPSLFKSKEQMEAEAQSEPADSASPDPSEQQESITPEKHQATEDDQHQAGSDDKDDSDEDLKGYEDIPPNYAVAENSPRMTAQEVRNLRQQAIRRGRTNKIGDFFLMSLVAIGLWMGGFIWFAESMPTKTPLLRHTEAIVVLTGDSERVTEAIDLLSNDYGDYLFVSGVNEKVNATEFMREYGVTDDRISRFIELGHDARDTTGNAKETMRWIADKNIDRFRLVTSNYHMRRSLLEFKMVDPSANIIPHPVNQTKPASGRWPVSFRVLTREYNKYLLTLARYGVYSLANRPTSSSATEQAPEPPEDIDNIDDIEDFDLPDVDETP